LDAWINEPLPESANSESEEEEESYGYGYGQKLGGSGDLIFSSGNGTSIGRRRGRKSSKYESEEDEETKERRRNERRERIKNDPFYIGDGKKLPKRSNLDSSNRNKEEIDVDSIPVVQLTMDEFDLKLSNKKSQKSKKSKGSKGEKRQSQSPPSAPPVIYTDIGEMPENATLSDEDKESKSVDLNKSWASSLNRNNGIWDVDFSGVANIDLSTPLGDDEKLPQMAVYLSPEEVRRQEEARVRRKLEERRLMLANERIPRTKKTKDEKLKIKTP
ncbi:9571_t:CDS:2, partial [Acaulospora morrowiae]